MLIRHYTDKKIAIIAYHGARTIRISTRRLPIQYLILSNIIFDNNLYNYYDGKFVLIVIINFKLIRRTLLLKLAWFLITSDTSLLVMFYTYEQCTCFSHISVYIVLSSLVWFSGIMASKDFYFQRQAAKS